MMRLGEKGRFEPARRKRDVTIDVNSVNRTTLNTDQLTHWTSLLTSML